MSRAGKGVEADIDKDGGYDEVWEDTASHDGGKLGSCCGRLLCQKRDWLPVAEPLHEISHPHLMFHGLCLGNRLGTRE